MLFITDNNFQSHPRKPEKARSRRSLERWENEVQDLNDGIQQSKIPVRSVQGILLCSSDEIKLGKFDYDITSNVGSLNYKFNYEDETQAVIQLRKFHNFNLKSNRDQFCVLI